MIIYRDFNCPRCCLASLFRAIWVEGRHISSAYEVRRVITGIMWPAFPSRMLSPDLPGTLDHVSDLTRIVRRSGSTIAPDGGPLATRVS